MALRYIAFSVMSKGTAWASETPGKKLPRAVLKKVRYVGALSRKLDSVPVTQK